MGRLIASGVLGLVFFWAAAISFAQTQVSSGPSGIGPIQIGMTKTALLALPDDELLKLVGGLSPVLAKQDAETNTEVFEARLVFPPKSDQVKARFTFQADLLYGLSLSTEGASTVLDGLAGQIAERYGPGKVEDDRKEEQCIYKNGSNFTIKSGSVSTKWITPDATGSAITTLYLDTSLRSCPANLRYASSMDLRLKHLYIRLPSSPRMQKKNLF